MPVELSEEDFKALEDVFREIKAQAVQLRMVPEEQKEEIISRIIYKANSGNTVLHNGLILTDEDQVELSR